MSACARVLSLTGFTTPLLTKFSLYVYFNDELKSLDEWIRETDLSGSFYFGGTLDYHY